MQVGFYFDQTRCTGCQACRVACKDHNDVPAGPENWMRVSYLEEGETPEVFVSYLIAPCWHCESPVCADACPVGAISKRPEDGIVVVDSEACLGKEPCGAKCLKACPYGAPQFGPETDAKMKKCDFCLDNWGGDKLPACIEACPTRALDAGDLAAMTAAHGEDRQARGFKYSGRTKPAVVFKAKQRSNGG